MITQLLPLVKSFLHNYHLGSMYSLFEQWNQRRLRFQGPARLALTLPLVKNICIGSVGSTDKHYKLSHGCRNSIRNAEGTLGKLCKLLRENKEISNKAHQR